MTGFETVRLQGAKGACCHPGILIFSALCTLAAGAASLAPASAQQRIASTTPASVAAIAALAPSEQPDALRLAVGDRLRVNIFERLGDAEDRWAGQQRQGRPDASFFLHQGMSGEVVVRADWRISIPLLGTFVADSDDSSRVFRPKPATYSS